jgi:hypothetical protein
MSRAPKPYMLARHFEVQKRMRSGGVTLWLDWGSRASLAGARLLLKEHHRIYPDGVFRIARITTTTAPLKEKL